MAFGIRNGNRALDFLLNIWLENAIDVIAQESTDFRFRGDMLSRFLRGEEVCKGGID